MPTGDITLTLLDDSWDSPTEDFSVLEESTQTWTHPDLGRIRERIKPAISPWMNSGWWYTGYQPLPGQKLDSRE